MSATTVWLAGVAELIGAHLEGVTRSMALLHKATAQALVLVGDDDGYREWAANARSGKFEPVLAEVNYTKMEAATALMLAFEASVAPKSARQPK